MVMITSVRQYSYSDQIGQAKLFHSMFNIRATSDRPWPV